MRVARRSLLGLALLTTGCPREVPDPEPPAGAPCETIEDCNPDAGVRGLLRACVDQRCEAEPSIVVP